MNKKRKDSLMELLIELLENSHSVSFIMDNKYFDINKFKQFSDRFDEWKLVDVSAEAHHGGRFSGIVEIHIDGRKPFKECGKDE